VSVRVRVRTHVVGRLGSGIGVNASFQIIPWPVGRLGLRLELKSVPRVGAVGYLWGSIFCRGLSPGELSSRRVIGRSVRVGTDKRTNKQTNRRTSPSRKAASLRRGLNRKDNTFSS